MSSYSHIDVCDHCNLEITGFSAQRLSIEGYEEYRVCGGCHRAVSGLLDPGSARDKYKPTLRFVERKFDILRERKRRIRKEKDALKTLERNIKQESPKRRKLYPE